jgi:leucyl/phenylalanyl-tRNA---protein transferase
VGDPERLSGPRAVPPSHWVFDPAQADEDGIVGSGADLEVATVVDAYRSGVFPWPHRDLPLLWFSPDPRAVIGPRDVRVSRSLRRTLRVSGWTTTMDADLPAVLDACADRPSEVGTWITAEMRDAYTELGRLGWAHSLEVWEGGALVGGLYGMLIGSVFTGESMFHLRTDASKVALVDLCSRLDEAGGELVDVQLLTGHLASMGAQPMGREAFLARLALVRDRHVRPIRAALPVARLAA